jgi:hypothetical protein
MVYNTYNYRVFGLCPSSDIVKTREHNVSETGSVYVIRLAISNGPNRVVSSSPSPEDGMRSSFRNVVFSTF